jgi:hypothetical protein
MGLDFIRRAAHTFHKGLDREIVPQADPFWSNERFACL